MFPYTQEHALIKQVTTENDRLLQENRKLLQQVNEQEEVGRNNRRIISTIQSRCRYLSHFAERAVLA